MPLDDAMPFLSRNFDQFVEMMKKKISAITSWVPPSRKVAYSMSLLADGRQLLLEELKEVKEYIVATIDRMTVGPADSAGDHDRSSVDFNGSVSSVSKRRRDSGERVGRDSEPHLPLPRSSDLPSSSRYKSERRSDDYPKTGTMQDVVSRKDVDQRDRDLFNSGRAFNGPSVPSGGSGIDFDSPAVQRALDDLLNANNRGGSQGMSHHGYRF